MKWKNFLKPDSRRLIIVAFIFFLTIPLRGIVNELRIESLKIIEKILCPHYLLYFLITPPNVSGADIVLTSFDLLLTILAFVGGIVYWYFLSCLIIFVYDKLKEKVEKGKRNSVMEGINKILKGRGKESTRRLYLEARQMERALPTITFFILPGASSDNSPTFTKTMAIPLRFSLPDYLYLFSLS